MWAEWGVQNETSVHSRHYGLWFFSNCCIFQHVIFLWVQNNINLYHFPFINILLYWKWVAITERSRISKTNIKSTIHPIFIKLCLDSKCRLFYCFWFYTTFFHAIVVFFFSQLHITCAIWKSGLASYYNMTADKKKIRRKIILVK